MTTVRDDRSPTVIGHVMNGEWLRIVASGSSCVVMATRVHPRRRPGAGRQADRQADNQPIGRNGRGS